MSWLNFFQDFLFSEKIRIQIIARLFVIYQLPLTVSLSHVFLLPIQQEILQNFTITNKIGAAYDVKFLFSFK